MQARNPSVGCVMVRGVPHQIPPTRRDEGRAGVTVAHATLNRWIIKYVPEYITSSYIHAPALLLPNATYDCLIGVRRAKVLCDSW